MALTADEVAARARNAAITADDHYYVPGGKLLDWPDGPDFNEELFSPITDMLAAYPHLADDLGYAWTADRSAYRTFMDVHFQRDVLELLADVDPGHPGLVGANPVAARMAINRDFVSYAQPGRDLDFIFIGRGFMDVLKYFMEMTLDIMDLAPAANGQYSWWGPANLKDICRSHAQEVAKSIITFFDRSTQVARGEFPSGSSPISGRLRAAPGLMPLTYNAVESFVVAHELAHLLNRHDVQDNTPTKEINADWAAISLQAARHGTQNRLSGSAVAANTALILGGPAFYQIGSLFYLILAFREWVYFKPIESYMETILQLKIRQIFYREFMAHMFDSLILQTVDQCGQAFHRIVKLCYTSLCNISRERCARAGGKLMPFVDEDFFGSMWDAARATGDLLPRELPRCYDPANAQWSAPASIDEAIRDAIIEILEEYLGDSADGGASRSG
ncbi:hypothetical protein ACIBI3_44645 [Actinomadura luteofluorescens]|uniref:hypothetical protein n=1 Tax=Actinomadura luteofluorescens TaxID=46163 RepID=UPI00348DDABE